MLRKQGKFAHVFPECGLLSAASRPTDTVQAYQRDHAPVSEVCPPIELCKVCGVDRGVDGTAERPIRLVYAARHLKRPLPSHAAQQRCTDKQSVAALPLMNIEPLTITKKGEFEWSAAENQGSVLIDDTDVS
jgi:hypothetical protein